MRLGSNIHEKAEETRTRRCRAGQALAWMLLAWCPGAFALDPSLDVSQYAHTSWKIRDGFSKGDIHSIAQTPDGYLWLGTEFGLLRFDGVKNVPWQPPPDQHLPSSHYFEPARRARRDSLDWHRERAGKLEGRQAHAVPGACRTEVFSAP